MDWLCTSCVASWVGETKRLREVLQGSGYNVGLLQPLWALADATDSVRIVMLSK